MAKFYGAVGFVETVETAPDVWDTIETQRIYCGDLVRSQRRWEYGAQSVNDDYTISNEVSLLVDDFMQKNVGKVRWVECMGSKWKVNSVTLDYPRMTLTLGGVYNGG